MGKGNLTAKKNPYGYWRPAHHGDQKVQSLARCERGNRLGGKLCSMMAIGSLRVPAKHKPWGLGVDFLKRCFAKWDEEHKTEASCM